MSIRVPYIMYTGEKYCSVQMRFLLRITMHYIIENYTSIQIYS